MDIKYVEMTNTTEQEIDNTFSVQNIRNLKKIKEYSDISLELEKKSSNIFSKKLYSITKKLIDIIGGIVGVILLIPIIIIVYITNKVLKEKGPIFYVQDRIGKDGKIFKMYKFRSMVVGADEKLEKYLQENREAEEEYRIYKKLKDDPRITKVGEFLRKTSLDEFPQFINVLKGDMSLVGPRPYLPREKEEMGEFFKYIVSQKPGLTGYWQVAGRNDVTFEDRLKMDMNYYHKSNIWIDIKLILKTIKKVLLKDGAV